MNKFLHKSPKNEKDTFTIKINDLDNKYKKSNSKESSFRGCESPFHSNTGSLSPTCFKGEKK